MNYRAGKEQCGALPSVKATDCNRWALRRLSYFAPALIVLAICVSATVTHAREPESLDDSSAEYFRGLRSRRLFRLAEAYCLERLNRGELSLPLRTDLTLELARTRIEHALYSSEAEQDELWKQARQVIDDLLKAEPANPRAILLEIQRALIPATSGHWMRWMAELQPDDVATARRAAQDLNESLAELRRLDGVIGEQVRKGSVVRPVPGGLSQAEWRSLGQHVRQHEGLALVDLAHAQPAGSPESAAALLEAQKVLKPLADSTEDDDSAWTSRVALVECSRLLGDAPRTLRDLQSLEKRSPPRAVADRLLAERLRLAFTQDRLDEVASLLEAREQQREPLSDELGFLQAELLARRVREANPGNLPDAGESLSPLEDAVTSLQRDFGGYWGMRAERLLDRAREERRFGPELAMLSRQAQWAFRQGSLSESAGLYGKAAALAHRQERNDLAFQFGYMRGSIEIKGQLWGEAAADLLELVEKFPADPKVAEAHLLAAYALERLYVEKPTRQRREELIRVLEEHRSRYPEPATRGEATWMLAELAERRGQFTVALKLYDEIPRGQARGPEALAAAGRCYEKILDRLKELQQPADAWEREAITTLQSGLRETEAAKDPLSRPQADAAIRLARFLLQRRPTDFVTADRWLQRVIESLAPPAPEVSSKTPVPAVGPAPADELRTAALRLRIVSLAGQGKYQDARQQLEQLTAGSPSQMLQVLSGLASISSNDKQDPFRELGSLQLQAAKKLDEERSTLSEADRRRLDECLAQGYAATGETKQAVRIYESLIHGAGRDRRLLTSLAELLGRDRDRDLVRRAPEIWQKIGGLSEDGSDEWLAARYQLCRSLLAAGNKAEACKLLKATRLLYPKLGGDKLRARFTELESKCGDKP